MFRQNVRLKLPKQTLPVLQDTPTKHSKESNLIIDQVV
jgi:hypothetical protein